MWVKRCQVVVKSRRVLPLREPVLAGGGEPVEIGGERVTVNLLSLRRGVGEGLPLSLMRTSTLASGGRSLTGNQEETSGPGFFLDCGEASSPVAAVTGFHFDFAQSETGFQLNSQIAEPACLGPGILENTDGLETVSVYRRPPPATNFPPDYGSRYKLQARYTIPM